VKVMEFVVSEVINDAGVINAFYYFRYDRKVKRLGHS